MSNREIELQAQLDAAHQELLVFRAHVQRLREALGTILKWQAETLEPMRQLAIEVSHKYEPCGYYCDEAVGHVDHKLANWAIYLYGDGIGKDIWEKTRDALAATEEPRENHV